MNLNVRSIQKNTDKLNNYLLPLDKQFLIIGLTETCKRRKLQRYMNFQNTKVFILQDAPEKEEEYPYMFTNIIIM